MRWLVIGLLVSVGALLLVAGAVARHVWRQRRVQADEAVEKSPEASGLDELFLEKPKDEKSDAEGHKGES